MNSDVKKKIFSPTTTFLSFLTSITTFIALPPPKKTVTPLLPPLTTALFALLLSTAISHHLLVPLTLHDVLPATARHTVKNYHLRMGIII